MSHHLERQINRLKKAALALGTLVEESVRDAIRAVETRDAALAERVIAGDEQIDQMEIDVEEECLHTLALHQPVAMDLRYVVAVLKINNDLERIGDLAVNIAEQARYLAGEPRLDAMPFDFPSMARTVQVMLKQSLDALVNIDTEAAGTVCATDDRVDEIHRQMYGNVERALRADPASAERLIHLLSVSRQLERIADHATNIAEDVIYMARGDITRHGRFGPQAPSQD